MRVPKSDFYCNLAFQTLIVFMAQERREKNHPETAAKTNNFLIKYDKFESFSRKKIRVTEMDYVTGLARKVKGQGPDVGLSPGSRNATDFVSLFLSPKKSTFEIKVHFRRSCRFQFAPLNRFLNFFFWKLNRIFRTILVCFYIYMGFYNKTCNFDFFYSKFFLTIWKNSSSRSRKSLFKSEKSFAWYKNILDIKCLGPWLQIFKKLHLRLKKLCVYHLIPVLEP